MLTNYWLGISVSDRRMSEWLLNMHLITEIWYNEYPFSHYIVYAFPRDNHTIWLFINRVYTLWGANPLHIFDDEIFSNLSYVFINASLTNIEYYDEISIIPTLSLSRKHARRPHILCAFRYTANIKCNLWPFIISYAYFPIILLITVCNAFSALRLRGPSQGYNEVSVHINILKQIHFIAILKSQ